MWRRVTNESNHHLTTPHHTTPHRSSSSSSRRRRSIIIHSRMSMPDYQQQTPNNSSLLHTIGWSIISIIQYGMCYHPDAIYIHYYSIKWCTVWLTRLDSTRLDSSQPSHIYIIPFPFLALCPWRRKRRNYIIIMIMIIIIIIILLLIITYRSRNLPYLLLYYRTSFSRHKHRHIPYINVIGNIRERERERERGRERERISYTLCRRHYYSRK